MSFFKAGDSQVLTALPEIPYLDSRNTSRRGREENGRNGGESKGRKRSEWMRENTQTYISG